MPEFDRSTPVTVAVEGHRGNVDIDAEDRATVVADVVPLDSSDASRSAAEAAIVTLEGDALVVRTPAANGGRWRRSANLAITVRVPTGSSLAVKTASADVHARGTYATAQVNTASGDLRVENVTGDARMESASGDVTIGRVGGALRMSSASGDLEIGDVDGDVSLNTASGDVSLRHAGASVGVDTASGDVVIGVVGRGRTDIRSASGDVGIGVAAGTGVWLDLNTLSGSTRSDLAMTGLTPAGDRHPQRLTGDGPDPTPPTGATLELRVQTLSGDIHVRRATVPAVA
jgi:DUF4097 and DUF4098 domain-containing protein YvlB